MPLAAADDKIESKESNLPAVQREREIERESSFVCCLHHRRGLCVRESEIELARGENPEWRTVCCSELSGDDKL